MSSQNLHADSIRRAASFLAGADALIVAAGAGMGVDSGLPDFRGKAGFWRAYPALGRAGIDFHEIANPQAFERTPQLAWGFYGHRLKLYRETAPHAGFGIIRKLAARLAHGAFVFTSNVDGQFQKAGFADEQVWECHGSIHHLQCLSACGGRIWPADEVEPEVDAEHCRLVSAPPLCPDCGGFARPNVLMFGDWAWNPVREERQAARFGVWRARVRRPVVIELGAGTSIPSVRRFAEAQNCPLIRINPDEPIVPDRCRDAVGIALGALAALEGIERALA